MNMLLLQRRMVYRLGQLGSPGLLGLVLLLLAGLAWKFWLQSHELELQRLATTVQANAVELKKSKQSGTKIELTQETALNQFYQTFPLAPSVSSSLKNVYASASKNGLVLETGEYSLLQSDSERLVRYRIALPVKGSFQKILTFTDAVLEEVPTMALESASFKRENVTDLLVDAKLVFVIYVGAQP